MPSSSKCPEGQTTRPTEQSKIPSSYSSPPPTATVQPGGGRGGNRGYLGSPKGDSLATNPSNLNAPPPFTPTEELGHQAGWTTITAVQRVLLKGCPYYHPHFRRRKWRLRGQVTGQGHSAHPHSIPSSQSWALCNKLSAYSEMVSQQLSLPKSTSLWWK